MNDPIDTCPPLNTPGAAPYPTADTMSNRCSGSRQHLPDAWGAGPYIPPYELPEMAPDEGINRWEDYGEVACTHICPFLQSFCDMKGIVCDARRLEEEKQYLQEKGAGRRLRELENDIWAIRQAQFEIDMLTDPDL